MFILLPCPSICDEIELPVIGQVANKAADMNKYRQTIKAYSSMEYLLQKVQSGDVVMARKVQFDNYLKAGVDLMKAYVYNSVPSRFSYKPYVGTQPIDTSNLSIKEQWAIEMVMIRFNVCSIYHMGAYSSLEQIFVNTAKSFGKEFKQVPKFINNLQITFKYFREGIQPLHRLSTVYDTLQQLLTPQSRQYMQMQKDIFFVLRDVLTCNLAYLKLEKYRMMTEYRSCKEGAYAVFLRLQEIKKRLEKYPKEKIVEDLFVYIELGLLFFEGYSYYYLLEEHEEMKDKEEYGFVKKEFQNMIMQNCVIAEEFVKIQKKISNFPNKENLDNAQFAESIFLAMFEEVQRKQYKYGINIHENKTEVPKLQEIITRRIAPRNIWESISQF